MGQFFAIEALRELRFPVEQDGCSPNASRVPAVHRRQTNPANVRQRRLRCLCPRVPMMKPAESRVGAKFAGAIRFLLDQPGARRLLTQTDVGSVVMCQRRDKRPAFPPVLTLMTSAGMRYALYSSF